MTRAKDDFHVAWRQFVLDHGYRANAHDLAAVVGQSVADILRVRQSGACARQKQGKGFAELFALWHGRAPKEADWPPPRMLGAKGTYEWQAPEIALLATLVGRLGTSEIATVLTARLRERTGDAGAERSRVAVQVRINVIGMQSSDVLGGITTTQAGREIGSKAIIYQAIHKGLLRPRRNGKLYVIPHGEWAAFKAKRTFPPKGYIMLSSIREALAIRSDKLSEFARMGYVPTAVRCNPLGAKGPSTQFGTWWIDPKAVRKLVADRRAGRPMPWHGKPMADNLRATFRRWQERRHPGACATCKELWGRKGAPKTFEDFVQRYPELAHGAKRHLTIPWTPGMTLSEVAAHVGRSTSTVKIAIKNGMLAVRVQEGRQYVTRTDATRWKARRCPTGDSEKSWLSLETACSLYLFTRRELRAFIKVGKLKTKTGTNGPMRGVEYVPRQQVAQLREKLGFTEEQAARRAGVTVARLRHLLEGVAWRKAQGIPLVTLQAVIKRIESRHGYTVEEAAAEAGTTAQWVQERIQDGTIKVSRAKWDRRRIYISEPMLQRLQRAKLKPSVAKRLGADWLRLSEAANEAGVCTTTLIKWAEDGELARQPSEVGWRYHREAVRARARRYWMTTRFHRATPPGWLQAEGQPTRAAA